MNMGTEEDDMNETTPRGADVQGVGARFTSALSIAPIRYTGSATTPR
jgi:hypothetical protein